MTITPETNATGQETAVPSIRIQVCYATPTGQPIRTLTVSQGSSLQDAIARSGLLEDYEIDLSLCRVGIFGKLKTLDTVARDLDRIEIYRGLIADPKDSRRKRVNKIEEEAKLAADKKTR
ncbi:RnfH family protein [Glaciimonas sp. GG7]